MTLSGALWCEQHHRWECAANVGRPHHANAIRGQAYCKNHVGKTRYLARAQGEANLLAWSTTSHRDLAPLDLGQVVMDQLRLAVMRADLYGELLRLQLLEEGAEGLVGSVFAAGQGGGRVATGERVRALAAMEGEWRDRSVRFAKTAHDMGIAESHIQLEQERANIVVASYLRSLDEAGSALLPEVRSLMVERFTTGLASIVPGEVVA